MGPNSCKMNPNEGRYEMRSDQHPTVGPQPIMIDKCEGLPNAVQMNITSRFILLQTRFRSHRDVASLPQGNLLFRRGTIPRLRPMDLPGLSDGCLRKSAV